VRIWVRSQDKELLVETGRVEFLNTGGTKIGFFEGECNTLFGEYESKEESLVVLDNITKGIYEKDWSTRQHVYQMPQKGFLKEKAPSSKLEG
jgi:hypothetical protein